MQAFALSNQAVRSELQEMTKMFNLPMQIDSITTITSVTVYGARGLMYTYKLSVSGDDLPGIWMVRSTQKKNVLDMLCTNEAMFWFNDNNVDLIYQYLDKDENPLMIFSINSTEC
tara:strand:- start:86 stop:430 length:345 start_codon:yes stop_codon:yes gene_type:complete